MSHTEMDFNYKIKIIEGGKLSKFICILIKVVIIHFLGDILFAMQNIFKKYSHMIFKCTIFTSSKRTVRTLKILFSGMRLHM